MRHQQRLSDQLSNFNIYPHQRLYSRVSVLMWGLVLGTVVSNTVHACQGKGLFPRLNRTVPKSTWKIRLSMACMCSQTNWTLGSAMHGSESGPLVWKHPHIRINTQAAAGRGAKQTVSLCNAAENKEWNWRKRRAVPRTKSCPVRISNGDHKCQFTQALGRWKQQHRSLIDLVLAQKARGLELMQV